MAVGQPLTTPTPPWPLNESEVRLVPHTAPVTPIAEVAFDTVRVFGVKPAVSGRVPPAPMLPVAGVSENCPSVGVPRVTAAAALPVLDSVSVSGVAAWFSGWTPKFAVDGELAAHASVAPVGVTDRPIAALACAGSLVVSASEPLSAVPAVADAGTTALTARVPVLPGATVSDVGVTEKVVPLIVAPTVSGAEPVFWMVKFVETPAAEPQLPAPSSIVAVEKTATGPVAPSLESPGASPTASTATSFEASLTTSPGASSGASPWASGGTPRGWSRRRSARRSRGRCR